MNIQKLHYENISGTLVRREGLLSWRCPLCKAEGQSPGVMHTCPECGSKKATLPCAQSAPNVPEGWIQRGMAELEAIRSRQDDDTLLDDRTLIERIGKAMLAAAPEAKP